MNKIAEKLLYAFMIIILVALLGTLIFKLYEVRTEGIPADKCGGGIPEYKTNPL
jgi:hypothetical protein